jgi:hypothetical protein
MKKNAFIAVGFSSALLFTVGNILPAMAKQAKVRDDKREIIATAQFRPNGNYFVLRDEDNDGLRVLVKYELPGDGIKKCVNKGGDGSRKPCPLKGVKKGLSFRWKLCVKDGDGESVEPKKPCTPWIKDRTGR